jgi:hypothetical protein
MSACQRDKVTVTGTARGQCPPQADSYFSFLMKTTFR